ncbi:zincin [Ceratobasidium sp. AG-I]|nr:zincin [Ceratobasidium sp. AG-I]
MLYSTLFLALLSASLSAAAPSSHDHVHSLRAHVTKRDGEHSLLLQVKPQDDINDPDDLSVAATLVNNGTRAVKILNDPNSVLSTWKTHTFDFVAIPSAGPDSLQSKASNVPAGVDAIRVKYNPNFAAGLDDDDAYTILQPGESKTIVHDLSGMYNFHTIGPYAVRLTAAAEHFRVIEDDGSISTVPAALSAGSATNLATFSIPSTATLTSLKGLVNAGKPGLDVFIDAPHTGRMVRRATDPKFKNCTAEQQTAINEALPFANQYIENANQYLNGTLGERYTTWFGAQMDNRTEIVKGHYANLTGMPDKFQFDCSCNQADTYAYVYPNKFPTVYFCGAFWRAPVNGTDSKAGTIVHEGTHFTNIGSTDDYAYGQTGAKNLAKSDPDRGVMNADSHEYFSENNPQLD